MEEMTREEWEVEQAKILQAQRAAQMRRGLFALVLMALGVFLAAGGVAWWAHPGAGLAIIGVGAFVIGCLTALFND